ncbi:MAG: stage II sporulation protein M [Clostridium sp.]
MNIVNKLDSKFRENKMLYILVLVFFCIGIVLGTYTIKYMNVSDSTDLSNYFTEFINSLRDKPVDSKILLFDIIKKNIVIIAIILVLSFTIIGSPIILLLDLFKGFTLGYTFAFLLTTFSGRGIWIAFASIIPQNLFYIPFFVGVSIMAVEMSTNKLKYKFTNRTSKNNILSNESLMKLGFLFSLFIVGVLIETFVCPNLIKFIATKFY